MSSSGASYDTSGAAAAVQAGLTAEIARAQAAETAAQAASDPAGIALAKRNQAITLNIALGG